MDGQNGMADPTSHIALLDMYCTTVLVGRRSDHEGTATLLLYHRAWSPTYRDGERANHGAGASVRVLQICASLAAQYA